MTQIPLPDQMADGMQTDEGPAAPKLRTMPTAPPTLPGPGAFMAQMRGPIDAGREPLERMGILERQAQALQMPDLDGGTPLPTLHKAPEADIDQGGVPELPDTLQGDVREA